MIYSDRALVAARRPLERGRSGSRSPRRAPNRDAATRGGAESSIRSFERAVGAHLHNALLGASGGENISLLWWRDGNDEADFVVERGGAIAGGEVKCGRQRPLGGATVFRKQSPAARPVLVGTGGLPPEAFFEIGVAELTWMFFG